MVYYSTNEFRAGLKIMLDGEPCSIINHAFVKPGKGHAFNRVRLRKLVSGKILEKTFKSGILVKSADVVDINLIYLYNDSNFWIFMNQDNYEQLTADVKAVGNNAKWLLEQDECVLTLWNNQPINVTPPTFVELKITKTDPGLKGNTVSTGFKIATLTTGAVVKVPLFIQIGEIIRVNTNSGEYVSRIK